MAGPNPERSPVETCDPALREGDFLVVGGNGDGMLPATVDVIKTRLQLDKNWTYKGIIHCGWTIVRTEGVRALWKGLTPFATHLTLKYILHMGSNAVFQAAFKNPETGKLINAGRLLSSFGAGVLEALVIVTHFEVVKIRLQQQRIEPATLEVQGSYLLRPYNNS